MSPLIAFHLPQFHAIPENDGWWGQGFTEWTNVRKAKPLFAGHAQPHTPGELGYYDLLDPETRARQAALARSHGISGFCYYHYWFAGTRLLEAPVNAILTSGEPDFPFCLCWANEPWTRAWDGGDREVLMPQSYSADDDLSHIRALLPAFADARYLRVDGKPLFLVYRAGSLPEPRRTTDLWRDEARKAGIGELFLARVESFPEDRGDPRPLGFDAAVEFAPDRDAFAHLRRMNLTGPRIAAERLKFKASYALGGAAHRLLDPLERALCAVSPSAKATREHIRLDYPRVVEFMKAKPQPEWRRFRGAFPGWDNTARRKRGAVIVENSTPQLYEAWLRTLVTSGEPVFINAWNEWAEGCHLEPCEKWGRAYLEATKRAVQP